MKCLFSLTFLVLLTATTIFAQSGPPPAPAAENIQPSQSTAAKLTNQDVIELLRAGMTSDELLRKIKSSPREFNTSDAAAKTLREAGVPDAVIDFIRLGETGEAEKSSVDSATPELPAEIVIPAGIQLDVEARYTVSSLDVKSGDLISFRVLVPIKVDGIVVIDKGALVTARVVEAKRGGHWGHAGRLSWSMQDVLAVDGSRIPLRPSEQLGSELAGAKDKKNSKSNNTGNSVRGTSHSTEVITKAIIPGILFPPLAPLGLIHGFKRGENAVLPEGKRFFAFVNSNTTLGLKPAR